MVREGGEQVALFFGNRLAISEVLDVGAPDIRQDTDRRMRDLAERMHSLLRRFDTGRRVQEAS